MHGERLIAHNQRFKELRRKKLERRENKIWRNSLHSIHRNEGKIGQKKRIDPKKLEIIKQEIRKKAKAQLKKERYVTVLIFLLLCVLAWIFS